MAAETNISIFRSYEGELSRWRKSAIKYDNFFRNKQYSNQAAAELRKIGLKPLTLNIVRPLLSQQQSILTSSKPTWRVVPLQGASKEVAEIGGRFLVGKWNSDYVDVQLDLVYGDMLRVGLGWLFIDCASFLDNSTFDINVRRINWKYVYPDPNCTEFDMSDAENLIIRKKVPPKRAQVIYQLSDSQLRSSLGENSQSDVNLAEVDVIDRFSKFPVNRVSYDVLKDSDGSPYDLHDMPPTIFYTSKLKTKKEAERRKYYEELKRLEVDGKVEVKELRELNIYRCISVGEHTHWEGIMNIRDYPLIPFADEFWGIAKEIDGETKFLEGIQEARNKFYMLTIHNAMLTGNARFMAPEGSIVNKARWQKSSMIPGSTLEWTVQNDLPNFGKPEQVPPGQLASAFYGLAADLQKQGEYQTSIFAPIQGNPVGSPETFSTTASLQEFGGQRIKRLARRCEIMIAKAGEVALQYIQQYTDINEMLEYIDDRPFNEDGTVNLDMGVAKEAGVVNQTSPEDAVFRIKNDSRIGKFAVKVLTQPNLGSDRLMKAKQISDMVMNKALPMIPSVAKRLFDMMELPGYQEIVAELKAQGVTQDTIKQYAQQLQVLSKQNQILRGEVDKLTKDSADKEYKYKLDLELEKVKSVNRETQNEFQRELASTRERQNGES